MGVRVQRARISASKIPRNIIYIHLRGRARTDETQTDGRSAGDSYYIYVYIACALVWRIFPAIMRLCWRVLACRACAIVCIQIYRYCVPLVACAVLVCAVICFWREDGAYWLQCYRYIIYILMMWRVIVARSRACVVVCGAGWWFACVWMYQGFVPCGVVCWCGGVYMYLCIYIMRLWLVWWWFPCVYMDRYI